MTAQTFHGFLLTRNWRDTAAGVELEFWFSTDHGPVCCVIPGQRSVFFLRRADVPAALRVLGAAVEVEVRELELRDFTGQPVSGLYFTRHRQARRVADQLREHGLEPLEADINPAERFLMERFIRGSAQLCGRPVQGGTFVRLENPSVRAAQYKPDLKVVSYDIETAMQGLQLYSIAVHARYGGVEQRRVFMLGEGATQRWVESFASQEALLDGFIQWLVDYDPDVLIGWNVVNFDTRYLQRLCDQWDRPLRLGRDGRRVHWRELDDDGQRFSAQVPGRVILDGIELLRAAFYSFESFSLENVGRELLGQGKLLHGGDRGYEITRQFNEDKTSLAQYNLKDCELVSDIFAHTSLLDFAIARSVMTGLNLDRLGGSVASFDNLYLPLLHRSGYVAPNASTDQVGSPGGFVLDSTPGLYDHVLVLDFKSLYPSIIRTFFIDPLGLALGTSGELPPADTVAGFDGGRFARSGHILPQLITDLWALRDTAKANGDQPLSQAIKIIMNSFYGVLGSPGCRFFDARLASSITRRGHDILLRTRDHIERAGHRVIYGDTDSVFVWIQEASSAAAAERAGRELESGLNDWWNRVLRDEFGLQSALELEFETHYQRFLMPTVRGSDKGSKKRYAGLVRDDDGERLVFKGLENVRTDWTRAARDFQEELYRRIFVGEPYEDYVKSVTARVLQGELDEQLVYRKRLRRRLADYQKNVPPHVQAARLCQQRALPVPARGDWVEYVVTVAGAAPAADPGAPLDYQHYVDRQLAPVADGILSLFETSFAELTDQQISLF
ncbi:MAG: DNA polymerase II [Gammaproteobacteria bacterium]|nr:DNA polymerase II [Gammaproteobacteria bacterium]